MSSSVLRALPDRKRLEAIADGLGLNIDEQEQWDFLLSWKSLDVQAAPGSGKTSLVVLKLAALAEAWTDPTRGICVLSHTNTAKHEIIAGLERTPAGRRLLTHPHFIGTIQDFIHSHIAFPALRSEGVTVTSVDDERYKTAAEQALRAPRFIALARAIDSNSTRKEIVLNGSYCFDREAGELVLENPFKNPGPSQNQVVQLREDLRGRGLFRYREMFAIAETHLHKFPWATRALRARYRYVLIDEMQDTSDFQESILNGLFSTDQTVLQRVGDLNQSVFSSGSAIGRSSFPRDGALELSVSRRFGPAIATAASALTVERRQRIRGSATAPEGTLALITFNQATVHQVIPLFEELARKVIGPDILSDHPPRVLGWRADPKTSAAWPKAITCYTPHYAPVPEPTGSARLLNRMRAACARLAQPAADLGSSAQFLWEEVRLFSHAVQTSSGNRDGITLLSIFRLLGRQPGTVDHRARKALLALLASQPSNETEWKADLQPLLTSLTALTGVDHNAISTSIHDRWLAYEPQHNTPEPIRSPDGAPQSIISTTASAKGETHSATLLLECVDLYGKKQDLRDLLPYLAGAKEIDHANDRIKRAAQLAFVAITRPRHLLALAIPATAAASAIPSLEKQGWRICPLSDPDSIEPELEPLEGQLRIDFN